MTITLDSTAIIALLVFLAAVGFWLVRSRRSPGGHDLSGPPQNMVMPKPGAARLPVSAAPMATLSQQGLTPARLEAIRGALGSGNKIMAIKLYREATGLGLAESKDAVEAMARQ